MKLTMLELVSCHRALPALADIFLRTGRVAQAVEVAQVVSALTPNAEVFKVTQGALLNAHGMKVDEQPGAPLRIVAGTEGAPKYNAAVLELLEQEVELPIEPIKVKPDDLVTMGVEDFMNITALIEVSS